MKELYTETFTPEGEYEFWIYYKDDSWRVVVTTEENGKVLI